MDSALRELTPNERTIVLLLRLHPSLSTDELFEYSCSKSRKYCLASLRMVRTTGLIIAQGEDRWALSSTAVQA